eukprot:CAMPEP_0170565200 /NCGR_PEP_ID=MMETSP0211-20121228/77435_1 /TAXON_ID=311385 /ORGANISM="Pseudokeronopsis sp., Strain OXSARD2" /LENGTH=106 /DNA_ID=CAMNT_0010885693 /DNA_START=120 /DNA_END=440 /DNA_ORIENTATION=-
MNHNSFKGVELLLLFDVIIIILFNPELIGERDSIAEFAVPQTMVVYSEPLQMDDDCFGILQELSLSGSYLLGLASLTVELVPLDEEFFVAEQLHTVIQRGVPFNIN